MEDINSISLTVVKALMEKYKICYRQIGRLEVGTETIIDKSKSVKSVLMQLFQENDNTEVEGIDTTNACYGGTAALMNAVNWIESSYWDGRYALVVAGDIAVYACGSARPTGGAGIVAMLIGPDAPLVFERGLRGTHMEHVYDFYKPDLASEFPEVDGPLTVVCFLGALDRCYQRYLTKLNSTRQQATATKGLDNFDYFCFHSPYTKLVQKGWGRLTFNDFLNGPDSRSEFEALKDKFSDLKLEDTYFDKTIEKTFMNCGVDSFETKVSPSLLMARNVGNTYCGSLYSCLCSLISVVSSEELVGKRIGMFSYGSGLASTMFSIRVSASVDHIANALNLRQRLDERIEVEPVLFEQTMKLREETHNLKNYSPQGNVNLLASGTFYLSKVDDKYRRSYAFKE